MRGAEILIVLLLFPVLSCTAQASRPTPTPDLPATVEALVGRRLSEILTAPAGAPALTMTPSPTVTPTHSPKPPVDYITFGSTKEDVLRIQGEPTAVLHEDWWWWGNDSVTFDPASNKVQGWSNGGGGLKVKIPTSNGSTHTQGPLPDYITFGSTKEDVLRIQGEPTAVSHEDWWWYGNDYILFDGLAGRVVGWENRFGNVKVKLK